ncbi:NB-ARC domain-containing protein [Krasilnikovia cinnamomea]|uniref:NB-ARC domain-containing protein n=1 Tax=Krasilnikovia cinnamomea TaxID=349313 RepID=A0A4Q7ZGA5_9ACTN|nr:tetratricopeptide repeat protein [Krasilnikovia cinnamomea]RZU49193.1 NB-ARC domain-containing protein [Krasilnikovia cinnamomea]
MPPSQKPAPAPTGGFAGLPDPAPADSLDDLVERLRLLKVWAGDPSYETIKNRVNAAWTAAGRPAGELARRSTVANCFQPGRRRFNTDLVVAVVQALHPDVGYVAQWRQTLRVIGGETEAVAQVRVRDSLPQDLDSFTGRTSELDRLRLALRGDDAVVVSAIKGMAGVGKTQLAIHAGHLLIRDKEVDRVLFVDLRGFHADRAQPPADPAAVLDGFLRLLGVPGQQIPHHLPARTAAYRDRLAGTRTLVVLDNAATAEQVRPLLADVAGCLTLVTSRRSLAELRPATQLTVSAFTPEEALSLLASAVPEVPIGPDPEAPARIARRCGYLPLALSLIAGHIRGTPGWTLTDHADRLDERHRDRRLDTGVELALTLSYQNLPDDEQRLLRLAALHPGQDFDVYSAAALADTDPPTARAWLNHLCRDHLLQAVGPERYTFHDLVRAYAATRAQDQSPPPERRAALTRLFDHYVTCSATAMNTLYPAEADRRPQVPPAATPAPDLTDPGAALAWLDTERPTLVAVAAHTATSGWPRHTTRLARTVSRYLGNNFCTDALTMHGHAHDAARDSGDPMEQAYALLNLGVAHLGPGRVGRAGDYLRQAAEMFRRIDHPAGQARALFNLGLVASRSGHYEEDIDYQRQALALYRRAGDRTGEAITIDGLGRCMESMGRVSEAIDYYRDGLTLARQTGNQRGEAIALDSLGYAELLCGRHGPAGEHLRQSLALFRQLRDRAGEAAVLDDLGVLHTALGRPDEAIGYHEQALTIFRDTGDQHFEAWALNGIGEAALAAGRTADALTHHTAACTIATDKGYRNQQARARAGLGHTHRALGDPAEAREHYEQALALYTDLGLPEAEQIRARLAELDAVRSRI